MPIRPVNQQLSIIPSGCYTVCFGSEPPHGKLRDIRNSESGIVLTYPRFLLSPRIFVFSLLALFFIGCTHHSGMAPKNMLPRQIVELFMETYGTSEMGDVAPYLSSKFRGEKPRELWVIDFWTALQGVQYKRVSGKVSSERYEKEKAFIEVETEISTVGGKSEQKELYILIKDKRKGWLIDAVRAGI